jgi:hypothetical protein
MSHRLACPYTGPDGPHGLGQIRFPRGRISAAFEEVRQVLEREGFIDG